jgi:broad specificity phosphatase PhoE
MEKIKIPIVKHLEDRDDLTEGRDAGLLEDQEEEVEKIAETLLKEAKEKGVPILVFCVSPKKRAQETAVLVKKSILEKDPSIKIITENSKNLREIDQGDFVLPENYKPGDSFEGLKLANKIFAKERFNDENPDKDNLLYKFGDPVLKEDGSYKYPELKEYFTEPGESYRDVLVRLYSEAVKLSENMEKFTNRALPIVFTHGQPHQIFNDLAFVSEKIKNQGFSFKTGELARICWEVYNERRKDVVPFGKVDIVDIDNILDKNLIGILKDEVEYLKNL